VSVTASHETRMLMVLNGVAARLAGTGGGVGSSWVVMTTSTGVDISEMRPALSRARTLNLYSVFGVSSSYRYVSSGPL